MEPADATHSVPDWLSYLSTVTGGDLPRPSTDEQAAILEITRAAAHRSERVAAPITAYALGLLLGTLGPEERLSRLDAISTTVRASGQEPGR